MRRTPNANAGRRATGRNHAITFASRNRGEPVFREGEISSTNSKWYDPIVAQDHTRAMEGSLIYAFRSRNSASDWNCPPLPRVPPIYRFSRMTLGTNQRTSRPTSNTASGGPNSTTPSNQCAQSISHSGVLNRTALMTRENGSIDFETKSS
jgi:hypothetical protein